MATDIYEVEIHYDAEAEVPLHSPFNVRLIESACEYVVRRFELSRDLTDVEWKAAIKEAEANSGRGSIDYMHIEQQRTVLNLLWRKVTIVRKWRR